MGVWLINDLCFIKGDDGPLLWGAWPFFSSETELSHLGLLCKYRHVAQMENQTTHCFFNF